MFLYLSKKNLFFKQGVQWTLYSLFVHEKVKHSYLKSMERNLVVVFIIDKQFLFGFEIIT